MKATTASTRAVYDAHGPAFDRQRSKDGWEFAWLERFAAIAALPGAACKVARSGLCAIFQTSACSRPPLPTSKTFKGRAPAPKRKRGL